MRLILFLIVFVFAAVAGIYIAKDPGTALFQYEDWIIEMPLWLVILGVVATIVLVIVFGWCIHLLRRLFGFGPRWLNQHQIKSANKALEQSMQSMAEGNWQQAERLSAKSIAYSATPLVAWMQAARAAQEQGHYQRRDQYLQTAQKQLPSAVSSLLLFKAQLQFQAGEWEASLATLDSLQPKPKEKTALMQLRCLVLQKLQRWETLESMVQKKKTLALPEPQHVALQLKITEHRIDEIAAHQGKQGLLHYWQQCPRQVKKQTQAIYRYARALLSFDMHNEAEKIVHQALKKEWDPALVGLYGEIHSDQMMKQIQVAEHWLASHEGDSVLLLSLAKLCLHHRLWGKAKAYLEQCIEIAPSTVAYAELGRLLGYLGEQQQSFSCYQKGLLLATERDDDGQAK